MTWQPQAEQREALQAQQDAALDRARQFPPIDPLLIDVLDRLFPDRAPDPGATDRAIHESIGAVQVVRTLRAAYAAQMENPLGP